MSDETRRASAAAHALARRLRALRRSLQRGATTPERVRLELLRITKAQKGPEYPLWLFACAGENLRASREAERLRALL